MSDSDLSLFRPTYKKILIWSWLQTIPREPEAVFFTEHRQGVYEFLGYVILTTQKVIRSNDPGLV